MPRTVDGIVEAHRIARDRVRSGRKPWDLVLDVSPWFDNEELSFADRRDGIVRKIRKSPWPNHNEDLEELLEELSEASSTDRFDVIWDDLYDLADLNPEYRVWIKTRR